MNDKLCMKEVLPYYKIEKTKEGKEFFFSNIGYFNFWDEYLIANTNTSNRKLFWVIVNRPGTKFGDKTDPTDEQKLDIKNSLANSIYLHKPEEMFRDFPELENYEYLKCIQDIGQERINDDKGRECIERNTI